MRAPGSDDICYATHQPAGRRAGRRRRIRPGPGGRLGQLLQLRPAGGDLRRAARPPTSIDGADDIQLSWLAGVSTIGLTAGASAPPAVVQEIIAALSGLGPVSVSERVTTTESIRFGLPKEVRS